MQLIVLGMHRSGTSVLARLLNLMGAYFGPEGASTGANQENPKGFWERKDVRALNDSLLFAAGCDWNRVAAFDPSKIPVEALNDFRKKAAGLVLDMDAHRPWLMKEPRLCLLMSLWRPLLESPVCLHIFRDPREVALSLQQRNLIPIDAGEALWERYVCDALRDTRGLPAIGVSHAGLISEPVATAARIYDQLREVGVVGLRLPSERELLAFVDPALHRQKATGGEGFGRSVAVYKDLLTGRAFAAKATIKPDGASAARLAAYEAGLPVFVVPEFSTWDDVGVAVKEAKAELLRVKADAQLLEAEKARMHAERDVLRDRVAKVESELVAATGQTARLMTQSSAYAREIDILRKQLTDAASELDRTKAELTSARESSDLALAAARRELEVATEAAAAAMAAAEQRFVTMANEHAEALAAAEARHEGAIELQSKALEAVQAELTEARIRLEKEICRREQSESGAAKRFEELGKLARILVQREEEIERNRKQHEAEIGKLRIERTLADWKRGRDERRIEREREALRVRLDSLIASRSWRLTKPFRMLQRKIGRSQTNVSDTSPGPELQALRESSLFDSAWYLKQYPDVRASGIDPELHYLEFGVAEGRDPGPAFSTLSYLLVNHDVARAGVNPLIHYMAHGKKEGRKLK